MTFMMTATPLAMIHHGHSLSTATLGIQWHILAMYAPAFITGRLISRFGPRNVCASGLLLTACAAAVSMIGTEVIWFWGGLILLGVGWNFGFVSATVMLSACYTHQERLKVQSLNDSFVFGTTALASVIWADDAYSRLVLAEYAGVYPSRHCVGIVVYPGYGGKKAAG